MKRAKSISVLLGDAGAIGIDSCAANSPTIDPKFKCSINPTSREVEP